GEDEGVLEGLAERVAVPQVDEVAQPDEMARPSDEGVREREVERHRERIGDEQQEDDEGRGDEERAHDALAIEELPRPPAESGAPGRGGDANTADGHLSSTRHDLL